MGNDFKIRVVENIGADSIKTFGTVGTRLEVIDGKLIDMLGCVWNGYGRGLYSINDINKNFEEIDKWQTIFELVEESNKKITEHEYLSSILYAYQIKDLKSAIDKNMLIYVYSDLGSSCGKTTLVNYLNSKNVDASESLYDGDCFVLKIRKKADMNFQENILDRVVIEKQPLTISQIVKEVGENAVSHGWWDGPERNFGELIALCHSELSEALEESRKGKSPTETYYREDGKPEGIPSELADVVIRVFDMCHHYGIDIESMILEKHEFNKSRPYKHGKEF